MSKNKNESVAIFWFRRDLRLHDNHGLFHALKSGLPVLPIFIFDENILSSLEDKDDARVTFIHESLTKIDDALKKYNSSLLVKIGKPIDVWKKLMEEWNIQKVFFNHDYEPYALERDDQIKTLLEKKGITVQSFKDHVIFEKSEIVKADGKPYTVFTPYSKIWFKNLTPDSYADRPSQKFLKNTLALNSEIPSLASLGFKKSKIHVDAPDFSKNRLKAYADSRNDPGADYTTRAGVHLRFGTISVRELVRESLGISEQYLTELAWREFFVQILHHFPHVVHRSFKPAYDDIRWINDEKQFDAWCKGETGYPLVDAGMRELNQTGFMHNRVRMVVASFLCKHLLIDWRWGEAYFARKLLDFDLSANNGNWQWAAGTGCDAAPYFRIFNPESQTERFDPDMKYILRWIPEYDPLTYIRPIVDHKFARERALKVYKEGLERTKG